MYKRDPKEEIQHIEKVIFFTKRLIKGDGEDDLSKVMLAQNERLEGRLKELKEELAKSVKKTKVKIKKKGSSK